MDIKMSEHEQPKPKPPIKRNYRACTNCRGRKAKCDLGDVLKPRDPPCSRCMRESRECVFPPSRRGGQASRAREESNAPYAHTHHPPQTDYSIPGPQPPHDQHNRGSISHRPWEMGVENPYTSSARVGDMAIPQHPGQGGNESQSDHWTPSGMSTGSLNPEHESSDGRERDNNKRPWDAVDESPNSVEAPDGVHRKSKSRRTVAQAAAHQSLVVADMHNESDALQILAMAVDEVNGEREDSRRGEGNGEPGSRDTRDNSLAPRSNDHAHDRQPGGGPKSILSNGNRGEGSSGKGKERAHLQFAFSQTGAAGEGKEERSSARNVRGQGGGAADLERFILVEKGILRKEEVIKLCQAFFDKHAHIFPMVPSNLIPRTPEEISAFARNEVYLMTALLIVASRDDPGSGMRRAHEESWQVYRNYLNEINYEGAQPTVGLVEGLLLLAENLPRKPTSPRGRMSGEGHHGAENRRAWMLTGMAIRTAYGLGLDKLSMDLEDEEENFSFETQRARLAWTYCYLFDRHISLRTGKAFWSRGPAICFQGYSHLGQTGPNAARRSFPYLIQDDSTPGGTARAGGDTDAADLVQAYLELTQLMTTAHDILYAAPARTKALVKSGEYFKHLDDFSQSLQSHEQVWRAKRFKRMPLTDLCSLSFHYVRLYILAFAFQAHVQRSSEAQSNMMNSSEGQMQDPASLFPRSLSGSPDARHIIESIRSAKEILQIFINSLGPASVVCSLPGRFLLWSSYASVFLLKAAYSGAMQPREKAETLILVEQLCACLMSASTDKEHPAVRYAYMLRVLAKRLARLTDEMLQSGRQSGRSTPGLPTSSSVPAPRSGYASAPLQPGAYAYPIPMNHEAVTPVFTDGAGPLFPVIPSEPFDFELTGFASSGNGDPTPLGQAMPFMPYVGMNGQRPWTMNNGMGLMENQPPSSEDIFAALENYQGEANELQGAGLFGLDLGDFFSQVGPGEAQGGFPFR